MLFSQRGGYKTVRNMIQRESMDIELRNSIWNAMLEFYWNDSPRSMSVDKKTGSYRIFRRLWSDYFKLPVDSIDSYWDGFLKQLKKYFYQCEWYGIYDIIEFMANDWEFRNVGPEFREYCNEILEREVSAYRFVGDRIVEITSDLEIQEIERALREREPFATVQFHLKRALDLMVDRENPDYRNSIKESISAVEAICKIISGNSSSTLGSALNMMERSGSFKMHGALKEAFSKLYGYTNDAEGIRHALMSESTVEFEDAKFMLVACSAFVNYLIRKWDKGDKFAENAI